MDSAKRTVYSSQTLIEHKKDLSFDILQFDELGGLIIQHNQSVNANVVVTDGEMEDVPRFTFTTQMPEKRKQGDMPGVPDPDGAAKLAIGDLQSDIKIVNVGKSGGDGGKGGDGMQGITVPPGSVNGQGGHGGQGGNGGNGGDGGDGPDLIITYATSNGSKLDVEMKTSRGGAGGSWGTGGCGGKSADGTLAPNGSQGQKGQDGKPGLAGRVAVNGQAINPINAMDEVSYENDFKVMVGDPQKSKLNDNEGFYVADYSNPDDLAYVFEFYGGEENLKQNYPRVYAACLKTAKEHANKKQDNGGEEVPGSLALSTPIISPSASRHKISTDVVAILCDPDLTIDKLSKGDAARPWKSANICVQYYDQFDPSIPYPSENYYAKNTNQFVFPSTVDSLNENEAKRCAVRSILNGLDPNKRMQTMKAVQPAKAISVSLIHEFTVSNPISKLGNNPIIMLYGRNKQSSSQYVNADYYDDGKGGEYYDNSPQNQTLKTLMPMTGRVEFHPGCKLPTSSILKKPDEDYTFIRSRITVGQAKDTVATHLKTIGDQHKACEKLSKSFSVDTTGFYPVVSFDVKGDGEDNWKKGSVDWLSDVSGVNAWVNNSVTYTLSAGFMISITDPDQVPTDVQLSITSCPADELKGRQYYRSNSTLVYVPPIEVHWGCFAHDTPVRLHTGTDKRMDELMPGDKVVSATGAAVTLCGMVEGDEETIFAITTINGTIRLTGGHPIMLDNGQVTVAGRIKQGDVMKGPNGGHKVILAIEEEYKGKVLNPIFEESGEEGIFILTNGFYCGDYNAQNKPAKPEAEVLTLEEKALVDEFEALNNEVAIKANEAAVLAMAGKGSL